MKRTTIRFRNNYKKFATGTRTKSENHRDPQQIYSGWTTTRKGPNRQSRTHLRGLHQRWGYIRAHNTVSYRWETDTKVTE